MPSSDSDDEELKRAIALSLGNTSFPEANVINLASDDEDDEDLKRAIALSLQENCSILEREQPREPATTLLSSHSTLIAALPANKLTRLVDDSTSNSTTPALPGLLGLNRKAMEEERLARLHKRKRSISPERPSKFVAAARLKQAADEKVKQNHGRPFLRYPKGAIKRTWAFKHPRTNDIKIEEVLQAPLDTAILSAFQFDDNWLFDKMTPELTKQMWIMSAKGEDVREKMRREAVDCQIPNFKQVFPPMPGQVQSMHSKLMLLFHKTHLRIVIPTANLIPFDWGETNKDPRTGEAWQPAVMENTVFLIDLPRRPDGNPRKEAKTPFGKELVEFLNCQEVPRNAIDGVLKHDFTDTKHLRFVHSIAGSHSHKHPHRTGLSGLALAIRDMGLDQVAHLEVDYAASSLGALKESFLKQLYLAASGIAPLSGDKAPADFLEHFRIYYPTKSTVLNSTGGPDCAGMLTLKRSDYHSPAFPKQCMRDYKSTRKGVLTHNKLLLARGRKQDGKAFAWVYVGSANISESAWGSQRILKTGTAGTLNIRNWECGVIVPVPEGAFEGLELAEGEVPPMGVFEGTLEVPFQYPGEKYEGREPWFSRN